MISERIRWRARPSLVLLLLLLPAIAAAVQPVRPGPDNGSNFYMLGGIASHDLDFDPRGADDFVAAGLEPSIDTAGALIGVGWVFRRPLRLDLLAGGWRATVDRPGVECGVGGAWAELHLAIAENELIAFEGTVSVGTFGIVYDGLPNEEYLFGMTTGLGLTARLPLAGPVGLSLGYQYVLGRYQPTTFEMPDDTTIRVQPTSRSQTVRILVTVDL